MYVYVYIIYIHTEYIHSDIRTYVNIYREGFVCVYIYIYIYIHSVHSVQGLGCRVYGLGFRVKGFGARTSVMQALVVLGFRV